MYTSFGDFFCELLTLKLNDFLQISQSFRHFHQKRERTIIASPLTQEAHRALERARLREKTAEFKSAFRQRAGIEGTMSQGVRAFGLRRSRYKSQAKAHLAHVATAAAINLARLEDWLAGKPMAATRQPALTQLLSVGA